MPSLAQLAYVGSLFEPMHQVGRVTPPLPLQRDTVLLFGHRLRLNAIAIGTPPSMTDLVFRSLHPLPVKTGLLRGQHSERAALACPCRSLQVIHGGRRLFDLPLMDGCARTNCERVKFNPP